MDQRAILLVCAVLAAVSPLATCLDDRYTDWSRLAHAYKSNSRPTLDAILKIKAVENDDPEDILNKIKKIREDGSRRLRSSEILVYDDLISLASLRDTCPKNVRDRVLEILSIWRHASGEEYEKLQHFLPFFHNYGYEHYGPSCQREAIGKHLEEEQAPFERQFGRFVAALKGKDLDSMDEYALFGLLISLDLTKDKLEVHQAVAVANEFKFVGEPFVVFHKFLLNTCSKVRKGRFDAMNTLALYNMFGQRATEPVELRVLNLQEIHRVCAEWVRSDKFKASQENIKKQF